MSDRQMANSVLAIEPLESSNVGDLADLLGSVDPKYFSHATPEAASRFLGQPADIHVLGRIAGEVVAFGMLRGWHEGYATPSLGIAVRPDREGRGYGRAMMVVLERLARERGATRIRLRVHPDNLRARRLYAGQGYREAGVERGETLMLLDLTPGPGPAEAPQRCAPRPRSR
jgi:ribosomal-protein-alanine N-acetyltransferase